MGARWSTCVATSLAHAKATSRSTRWISSDRKYRSPQNALALTGVIFPLALAYALSRGGYEATGPVRV